MQNKPLACGAVLITKNPPPDPAIHECTHTLLTSRFPRNVNERDAAVHVVLPLTAPGGNVGLSGVSLFAELVQLETCR